MIPVIWYKGQRGRWDHGLLLTIFDKYPDIFPQYNEPVPPKGIHNGIVIISGCENESDVFAYLSTMNKCLVILTSEEDAFFQWKKAIPPQHEIWTAYYNPQFKSEIKTRLLLGAPTRIKDFKINTHLPKKYLWSFIGQIQNPHRQKMVEVLKTMGGGLLKEVQYFGGNGENATEYLEYLEVMAQSKFVLAGSGSMSVDSFRLYECMETGAIPITEKRSPRDPIGFNYWNEVFPKHTVLTVDNWEELKTMPLNEIYKLTNPYTQNLWWGQYKQELEEKLLNYAAGH